MISRTRQKIANCMARFGCGRTAEETAMEAMTGHFRSSLNFRTQCAECCKTQQCIAQKRDKSRLRRNSWLLRVKGPDDKDRAEQAFNQSRVWPLRTVR